MPNWYPSEYNQSRPSDDELRSLHKRCDQLFTSGKSSPFPEGCVALPSDDEERALQKIRLLTS